MSTQEIAADRAKLIEALFHGYKVLGFDTDGCETGACYLSHCGLGGNNLDAFIAEMEQAFKDARADHDEAIQ